MEKSFQSGYAFTTENISGYISNMDIKNKSVLTLGSSCDQAFNCLLLDAKNVTIFDINKTVEEFYEFKRKLILEVPREKLIEKVLDTKQFTFLEDCFSNKQLENMNLYLKNDINYQKLREVLEKAKVKFITGDIFDIESTNIGNDKYDRVILSNVLQYLKSSAKPEDDVYDIYNQMAKHLNEDAIVQLYYLYGNINPINFARIINKFDEHNVMFERIRFDGDSVILTKRRNF